MSVATEILRLQTLRNAIRTKLITLKIITKSDATFDECKDAIEGIADNGAVSGTISTKDGTYTVPAGYHNGSGVVGISETEQSKIIAGNIKSGVQILGVTGDYEGSGVSLQSKDVTPTKSAQNITPDDGYDGLSAVNVAAIPDEYAIVSNVTADAPDVLANKVFVDATGTEKAGTMVNNGAVAKTIDGLTETSYTIPAGYHNGIGSVSLTNDIETALAAI